MVTLIAAVVLREHVGIRRWTAVAPGFAGVLIVTRSGMGVFAETLVIKALDVADAVVVAPVHYSIILCAIFYGFIVFDQLPDIWTWVGASIIVVMGIYTLHREWRVGAKKK